MNFGQAIEALKTGGRVARAGWNGKGMFIFMNKGEFPYGPRPDLVDGVNSELFDYNDEGDSVTMPTLCMNTASGSVVVGWLASQTDILADDWQELVEVNLSFEILGDPRDLANMTDTSFLEQILASIASTGRAKEETQPVNLDDSYYAETAPENGKQCNCFICALIR